MGTNFFADIDCDDRQYDNWAPMLVEASARLEALQTAVTALCRLCASRDVHSDQVLDVLERHGAISKADHARYAAA